MLKIGADLDFMGPVGTVFCKAMLVAIRILVVPLSVALCMALGLTIAGAADEPPQAHEFSADIVNRDAGGKPIGTAARLYVANRKVRIETPEASAGFFLIDGDAGTAIFVSPTQGIFMTAKQSTRLTQIFVPIDPNAPCRQWQAAAKEAGAPSAGGAWRCERIDSAMVNGRGTAEYRVFSPEQPSQRWIDSELGFPVKLRAADGTTIGLEHIRIENQPASLFAVPSGYRKLEPQALIERIKHSDVWVDSPAP
jgi:hypothetical protein